MIRYNYLNIEWPLLTDLETSFSFLSKARLVIGLELIWSSRRAYQCGFLFRFEWHYQYTHSLNWREIFNILLFEIWLCFLSQSFILLSLNASYLKDRHFIVLLKIVIIFIKHQLLQHHGNEITICWKQIQHC